MDLSLFQFDTDQTFAVFFLNADRTIYGRYGSRNEVKDADKLVSLQGLKMSMRRVLELHAAYPANKKDLAGKSGPKPTWSTPEQIPENRGKPNIRLADGSRNGCVHCHQAHDAALWTLRAARQPIPDRMIWFYPMPDVIGLSLDPDECATVTDVATGSAAEKAGLKKGDRISRIDAQPIISVADVQWVLQNAKDGASLKLEIDRGGQSVTMSLAPAAGWRQRYAFTWRLWTWSLRHRLVGTDALEAGSSNGTMALRVKGLAPDWAKDKSSSGAQFRKDDVIVEVDGRKDLMTEGAFLSYLLQKKAPGSVADLVVQRGGKRQKIALKIP